RLLLHVVLNVGAADGCGRFRTKRYAIALQHRLENCDIPVVRRRGRFTIASALGLLHGGHMFLQQSKAGAAFGRIQFRAMSERILQGWRVVLWRQKWQRRRKFARSVLECVHLFRDDVRVATDAAGEELSSLEDGWA